MVLDAWEKALHNIHTEILVRKPRSRQVPGEFIQISLQLSKAYVNMERDQFELKQKPEAN